MSTDEYYRYDMNLDDEGKRCKSYLHYRYRGAISVIGGTLTHLTLGTMYCWGNFISYMPPTMLYFSSSSKEANQNQDNGESVAAPDALFVLPITMLFMCIAMPFSSTVLQRRLGSSTCMLLGSCIMSGGVFFSSFSTTLESFLFLYCVCFGTGVGIAYTAPIAVGWQWFPTHKGLVSGCVLAGFGSGGFIFNLIGTAIVNPSGISPIEVDVEGDGANGATSTQFPEEVYSRFPLMLRSLAIIYMVFQIIGFFCVRPPPADNNRLHGQAIEMKGGVDAQAISGDCTDKDDKEMGQPSAFEENNEESHDYEKDHATVYEAIRTGAFWLLWLCIMLSASAGLNVVSIYKMYGNSSNMLNDDGYLAIVGGLGSVGNGVGRTLWGWTQDRFGTRRPFMVLTTTQGLVMFLYHTTLQSKGLFGFATFTVFLCMGGNFAMAPGACAKLFGARSGPKVFSILFSSFATAAIVGSAMSRSLLASHGFDAVFYLMGILSVVAGASINGLKSL